MLIYSDFIQAWRIEKHVSDSSLGVGGGVGCQRKSEGGEGMSEEVETLGEAPPPLNDLLPRTVKKFRAVFLFRDPPLPKFLDSSYQYTCNCHQL